MGFGGIQAMQSHDKGIVLRKVLLKSSSDVGSETPDRQQSGQLSEGYWQGVGSESQDDDAASMLRITTRILVGARCGCRGAGLRGSAKFSIFVKVMIPMCRFP